MKPTAFLGCDPGMNGAIAILRDTRSPCIFPIFPMNGEIDIWTLKNLIANCIQLSPTICVIEQVFRPNKLVYCAGMLEGMLASFPLQVVRVAPVTWRKEIFGEILDYKKSIAVEFCQEHYPEVNLLRTDKSRKPDHNIAEAVCIAHYARLRYQQWENTAPYLCL